MAANSAVLSLGLGPSFTGFNSLRRQTSLLRCQNLLSRNTRSSPLHRVLQACLQSNYADADASVSSLQEHSEIVFMGTGTSEGIPRVSCLTNSLKTCSFGFLVIGKEFDQYPKSRIRDTKQWEWFLEDSTNGNDDDDGDDGDKKKRKGLSKKRRRKKGNEDDDWSAESEEDKELMVKSKSFKSQTYSTRSKKTNKDVNATSSSRDHTKQRGRVDIEEDEDDDDETLGGFIVSDEEAKIDEEDEQNTDEEEEEEDDEDEE